MLPRAALEDSPLADLHVLASELGIYGYRRLRKAELIDRLITAQGGDPEEGRTPEPVELDDDEPEAIVEDDAVIDEAPEEDRPRRRGRRGGRGRSRDADSDRGGRDDSDDDRPARAEREPAEEKLAEGVVELLGNGSGFLRVNPPDPSDDDVYVSAAQVRRCELVSGDTVAGPVRAPRRSERYPSLVRVDTINGRPADEVAEGTHFDDLPCGYAAERFALGAEDPTLKAIEWLTPFGRGSRVALVGPAHSGKSEALRRLAGALNGQEAVDQLSVVLTGVRPEEVASWKELGIEPLATLTLSASSDAQGQAAERAVETARRVAARGGHAVVIIDSLDSLSASNARRALGAARNIDGGGSLTVLAASSLPLGGETTVIAFDRGLTSTGRFPALDLTQSGTLRPELLVGQAGADAIAQARAAAMG